MSHPAAGAQAASRRDVKGTDVVVNIPGWIGKYGKVYSRFELYEGLIPRSIPAMAGLETAAGSMLAHEPLSWDSIGGNLLDVTESSGGFDIALVDIAERGEKTVAQAKMAKYLLRAEAIPDSGSEPGWEQPLGATLYEVGRLLAFSVRSQKLSLLEPTMTPTPATLLFAPARPGHRF